MKAITCHNDGSRDVLQYEEIEKPVPGDKQVLIRVGAASVNPLDGFPLLVARLARVTARLRKPKISRLGTDVAGQVEAVGAAVTQFKPGDEVFGMCLGAFAEYVCTTERNLAPKPANISFEQAAAVPVAAITALQALRDKGNIQPGQKVLVDGASGGVGTFTIQLAKYFQAEVTATCSPRNVETAHKLGADHVIDYTLQDFARSGQRYDLIIAANAHHSLFAYKRALVRAGTIVVVGGGIFHIVQAMLLGPVLSRFGTQPIRFFIAETKQQDLLLLRDLLESGTLVSVIDKSFPLSQTAEAIHYRDQGHARGKVIITV